MLSNWPIARWIPPNMAPYLSLTRGEVLHMMDIREIADAYVPNDDDYYIDGPGSLLLDELRESLSEDVYRSPGPKPQTRTAALLMMADAVEASSRVLHDPTPARISALVDKIINHIFLAGQLEECELTFKDISEIKSRFTYILNGILHKRIDYPGFDLNQEGASRAGEGKQQADREKAGYRPDPEGLPNNPYVSGR
ncbi:hypothetical protein LCGC14_2936430 [marine sediment metagenome]|uniref:Uncharacterized protein n=1 Tax=marine sediment metagenome TaxID=412755 RepID=A0A0F8Y6E7_9ZZZZ